MKNLKQEDVGNAFGFHLVLILCQYVDDLAGKVFGQIFLLFTGENLD